MDLYEIDDKVVDDLIKVGDDLIEETSNEKQIEPERRLGSGQQAYDL